MVLMKKYIDAENAKSAIATYHTELKPRSISRLTDAVIADVLDIIDELPAVDAEPVRHGEWIYQDGEIMLCKTCSLCRCESFDLDGAEYCPYCGAKMDLEDEQ